MSQEIYTVVPVGEGCSHCNAGEHWDVVFKAGTDEEMGLSTSYGDKEQAEDVARDCNDAYAKGKADNKALLEIVEFVEWRGHNQVCPICHGSKYKGHGAMCNIGKALAEHSEPQ